MPRPKSFDQEKALDAAVACFWDRGYEATSVRDLTATMGISGPSLYNAFGDKRALFAQALDYYCATRTHRIIATIESKYAPTDAIPALFTEVIERSVSDRNRRGCLLVNSALEVAPHDAELRAVIGKHLGEIRNFFLRCLVRIKPTSSKTDKAKADATADQLLATLLGIRVLARSKPQRVMLERIVHSALEPLGLTKPSR